MAALFLQSTNSASALELTNLEPHYSDDSQIELLTPEDGYDFDANFLDNNQTLTYTATVRNDEDKAIKITAIDFTTSSFDFLDYSYDGIEIGSVIEANQSIDITITIQTNDQTTRTVDEDLSLNLNYQLIENPVDPTDPNQPETPENPDSPNSPDQPSEPTNPESTENPATSDSAIIMAVVALISIIAIVVLVRKTNRRTLAIVLAIPFAGLLYSNFARAEGDLSFSIVGKVRFTNVYTISIDPNGGEYDGETEVKVREGDIFTPANVTRDTYDFASWEVNPGELDDNNQIEIHANTTLKALWNEIYYTLTIKPNGGEYNGNAEDYQQSYRPHEYATVLTPTRTGHSFTHYNIETGGTFDGGRYQMESNTTLIAQYDIDSYTVTIDPNGGSYDGHTSSYSNDYDYNSEITMGQATRAHYRFTGWEMSAGNLDANNKFHVTQSVKLTAQWEPINFTLTIDPNGGSYENHDTEFSKEYLEGSSISLSTPTKEHYHFDYWILENDSHSTEMSVTMNQNIKLKAHYAIDQLHVTVNPAGGSYKNSTAIYEADLDYGTELTLRNDIARENYILSGWTQDNVTSALDRDVEKITIVANTNLVAEWHETRLVTVDPNGGVYDNSTDPSEYRVELNTTFTLDEATKDNYVFDYWTVSNTDRLEGNSKIITDNTVFRAEWFFPVARIERTQKLYPSIMAAEAEAQNNDIITLLVDTEEIVTNEKTVTLDLNYHTITGYLINTATGNITLVNGEINNYNSPIHDTANPNGAAVVNYGNLTMGIDDYAGGDTNQKTPLISADNIRLVGTDVGLLQAGHFDFFDGYIEGIIGLDGSYDHSPWYRDTFDGVIVYYFPFVDRNVEKDCQHVSLENSDKAVSKTINGGEIYYYNLQDNINTSARTGFDIYAVRNFDASYPITVAHDTDIVFDLNGWTVNFGEETQIEGNLTLRDSKTGDEAGLLTLSKTLYNNGTFTITNTTAKAITTNNFMQNNGNLVMRNATITSDKSTTVVIRNNGSTYDLDDASYITSDSSSTPTILNYATDLTITSGHITSNKYIAIKNQNNSALTVSGGEISNNNTNGECAVYGEYGSITLTMTGGKISSTNNQYRNAQAVCGVNIEMTGGEISASSDYNATAITGSSRTVHIKNGIVSATSIHGYATAFSGDHPAFTVSGDTTTIQAISTNSYARCINGDYGSTTINGGRLIAESTNGTARVIDDMEKTVTINGGELLAHSVNNNALGIGTNGRWSSYINVHGGSVRAISDNTNYAGTGISSYSLSMDGGEVYGSTYGIRDMYSGNNTITGGKIEGGSFGLYSITATLGKNDIVDGHSVINTASPEIKGGINGISGGYINYYDGILKGGSAHINSDDIIKAVPDGAHRHIENVDEEEHCWLEADEDYLEVNGETFNSLTGAYGAVEDGGTINVIADASTAAVLPTNTKNITFNLGDHTVTYMQPLKNNGSITFVGTGTLKNTNANFPTVENYGTIKVTSGHIVGIKSPAVKNMRDSSMAISGGEISTIDASNTCTIYGDSNNMTLTMTGGKVSANNTEYHVTTAVCGMHIEMTGGEISASSVSDASAINGNSRVINISNGTVSATTSSSTARGLTGDHMTTTISGNNTIISVSATSTGDSRAVGIDGDYGSTTINGGKIAAEAAGTGYAYAINDMEKTITINGGEIFAHSVNGDTRGIGTNGRWSSYINVHGGTVRAISDNTNRVGTGISSYNLSMDGGEVYGSTYGIHEMYTGNNIITAGKVEGGLYGINNTTITIGVNDTVNNHANVVIDKPEIKGGKYAINGGNINFYDGILKGGELHVNDVSIFKAIPDGTHRHTETVDTEEHCWLVEDEDYLEVNGETFNSLTGAYGAVEDGGTINVIANASTAAVLPTNTKHITFNLNNFTLDYKQPLKNSGSITFVGTGYIIGSNSSTPTIENSGSITIESGHFVNENMTAIKNLSGASLVMNGGEISSSNADNNCAVNSNGDSSLTMTGGKILANNTQSRRVVAVCNVNVTMSGGEIIASSGSDATAISGSYRTINISNGIVSATTVSDTAHAISGDHIATIISGADTIVRAEATGNGRAATTNGDYGSMTVNGGKVIAESAGTGYAYVIDDMEKTITINDGEISAHSINGDTRGIGTSGRWSTYVNIKGGKVSAISDNPDRVGTGSTGYNFRMTGGEVYGSTYGVRDIYSSDATIGENDGELHNGLDGTTDKPLIRGGTYGIYNSSFKFYDGVIEGGVAPHFDRNIKAIANNTNILYGQETIDGKSYETARLVTEQDVARIGDGADAVKYKSLDTAISQAQANDTIYLIRDAYTYSTLNIPAGKDITIDLNGNNLIAANHIDNSGNVVIKNSSDTNPVIEYHDSDVFIQNRANASLELNGLKIKANRIAANNGGTLSFVDSELSNYTTTNEYFIRNYSGALNIANTSINFATGSNAIYADAGSYSITDSIIKANYGIYSYSLNTDSTISNSTIETLYGSAYSVYAYGGDAKLTINNNSKILGNLYFNAAQLSIKDTEFEETSFNNETNINIDRNATAELDNVTVKHTQADAYNGGGEKSDIRNAGTTSIKNSYVEQLFTAQNHQIYNQARVITNTGTLSIDNTTIKQNDYNSSEYSSIAIYSNGNLSITNSTITTARSLTSAYGIYNDGSGSTHIDTSSITVTGKKAYGLYINSGELTLGEPEPEFLTDGTRNPKYGRSDANVSTSTPLISAIGTNPGVAVTMNGGTFNFYDGKLVQNNPNGPALQPDGSNIAISNVEYIYQPEVYEDIYGNYYFILEFMRNP